MVSPETVNTIQNIVTIAAILIAGIAFGVKWITGYFFVSLSVAVSCDRRRTNLNPNIDHLAISVHLSKGNIAGLFLRDAKARVRWSGQKPKEKMPKELVGIRRIARTADLRIPSEWSDSKNREHLNFPPGDTSQFGCYFEVPADEVCTVEVVILGQRRKTLFKRAGQWRASTISLPLEE